MSTMLIGYDLNNPGQNYTDVIETIKSMANGWWHHLDSTWLINTSLSTSVVRDRVKAVMDARDKALVIDVSGDPRAWWGFSESGSKWLKETFQ